jgi:hypothetical protein
MAGRPLRGNRTASQQSRKQRRALRVSEAFALASSRDNCHGSIGCLPARPHGFALRGVNRIGAYMTGNVVELSQISTRADVLPFKKVIGVATPLNLLGAQSPEKSRHQ